jgi:hypothetical protein
VHHGRTALTAVIAIVVAMAFNAASAQPTSGASLSRQKAALDIIRDFPDAGTTPYVTPSWKVADAETGGIELSMTTTV